MNAMKQGEALPTERATERNEYEATQVKELDDARPKESALTPEQVQSMTISEETAIWISTYSKVQELFDYIRYAYVATYAEEGAGVMMEKDKVLELWEALGDTVLNGVKESMYHKLGVINPTKL